VLTAAGVGILVLAGAYWFGDQVLTLVVAPPKVSWKASDLGSQLAAWGKAHNDEIAGLHGIREVLSHKATSAKPVASVTISDREHSYDLTSDKLQDAVNYRGPGSREGDSLSAAPTSASFSQSDKTGATVVFQLPANWATLNLLYIQLACGGVIVLFFAGLMWWTLNRPRIVEFAIATEAEMRKVNWPTRYEVLGSTWVVICGTLLMAVFLFSCDFVFTKFFHMIKILGI
jgi:preprotein translocase SecE subunit